jgi:GxxExxY protein
MTEDELSNIVIGLAIKVHKALGPGLLESSYKECLYYEIKKPGFKLKKRNRCH